MTGDFVSASSATGPIGAAGDAQLGSTMPKRLEVSRYDRASAGLITALILTSTAVLMLFIIWASTRVWTRPLAVEPVLVEPPSGGGNAMGMARELVEPGEEEIEDLSEPQLEQTIDAVTDTLSAQLATLDALGGSAPASTQGGGAGDRREPGPGGPESNILPRAQRWEILFAARNLDSYAKQLDFFNIELAAVGSGSGVIDYASNFSGQLQRRQGEPENERRMYLTWRYGPLRQADIALLKRAKISTQDRILMQFLPQDVENRLANVEKRYCENERRTLEQVRKTIFEVKGTGGGYKFEVKEQKTR